MLSCEPDRDQEALVIAAESLYIRRDIAVCAALQRHNRSATVVQARRNQASSSSSGTATRAAKAMSIFTGHCQSDKRRPIASMTRAVIDNYLAHEWCHGFLLFK